MCPFSGYSCTSSHMHAICATHMRHQFQKATSQLFKWLLQLLLAPFHKGLGFVCDSRSAAVSSAAQTQQVHKVGEMLTMCKIIFFLTFSQDWQLRVLCVKLAVQDPKAFCWISILFIDSNVTFLSEGFKNTSQPTQMLLSKNSKYSFKSWDEKTRRRQGVNPIKL